MRIRGWRFTFSSWLKKSFSCYTFSRKVDASVRVNHTTTGSQRPRPRREEGQSCCWLRETKRSCRTCRGAESDREGRMWSRRSLQRALCAEKRRRCKPPPHRNLRLSQRSCIWAPTPPPPCKGRLEKQLETFHLCVNWMNITVLYLLQQMFTLIWCRNMHLILLPNPVKEIYTIR